MEMNSPPCRSDSSQAAQVVTIAIASVGRSTLAKTLESIQRLVLPDGITIQLLVADDSFDGRATRLCAAAKADRFPPQVIAVASRNISIARNALLEQAAGAWIAFIDDDEWIEQEDWLVHHLLAATEFGADAVIGPVVAKYSENTPAWMVSADPYTRSWGERGERIETGSTSNAFVNLAKIRHLELRFGPSFGRTGGGDTDFFYRLYESGGVVIATDDAVVLEAIPEGRLRLTYLVKREEKGGQAYGGLVLRQRPGHSGRIRLAIDGSAKLMVAVAWMLAVFPFDRGAALSWFRAAARNGGKLRAALGLPKRELYGIEYVEE